MGLNTVEASRLLKDHPVAINIIPSKPVEWVDGGVQIDTDYPTLIYLVDSGDKDHRGDAIWFAYTHVDDIPEEYDGEDVLVFGLPTKHTFAVSKRITA